MEQCDLPRETVEHALSAETARRSLEAALKQAADRTVAEVGDGRG